VDVGRACAALGGGGHARAAGFTAHGTPDQVMTALRRLLAPASPGRARAYADAAAGPGTGSPGGPGVGGRAADPR
jgi:hypothetical protein